MKTKGRGRLFVDEMQLPPDFDAIVSEPAPRPGVVFTIPMVRKRDNLLIVGKFAVAAKVKKDGKGAQLHCRMIECSDEEAHVLAQCDVAIGEAAMAIPGSRRDSLKLIDVLCAKFEQGGVRTPGQPGRPNTLKGMLMSLLAAQDGITLQAFKNAETRRNKAAEDYAEPNLPVRLDSLGMELSESFENEVTTIQSTLYTAAGQVSAAVRKIRSLKDRDAPANMVNVMAETAKSLVRLIQANMPESLCPFCRGLDGYQEQCGFCQGTGWISKEQKRSGNIPEKLLDPNRPMIMAGGKELLLEDLIAEREVEPEASGVEHTAPTDDLFADFA